LEEREKKCRIRMFNIQIHMVKNKESEIRISGCSISEFAFEEKKKLESRS
jgi:hypothetical protein